MRVLALATFLLLTRSASSSCNMLGDDENVADMDPFKFPSYDDDAEATMTCVDNYIISWAASADDGSADIKCVSGSWAPEPAVDGFSSTVGCVACLDGVADCIKGTCTDGGCICDDGYEKSDNDDLLRCTIIQCDALTLSNQEASAEGPYDVNTVVTVTCTDGYHVAETDKADGVAEQTLTCNNEGNFDITLKPCVVCAGDDDCKDGTCNDNNMCECDEGAGYKLSADDLSVCLEVTCPDNYCSNNGECTVKGIELECDCQTGTTGDTCAEFTTTPCDPNPCNPDNGGTCARVMDDPTDYTKHKCTCTDDAFDGDSCEFAKNFHVGDEGITISDTSLASVEFDVVTAGGITSMYIALLQVTDNDDKAYKVLLLKSDDTTLTLHVIAEDQSEKSIEIVAAVKVKIHIDTDNENKLTLNAGGNTAATDLVANEITDLVIGGTSGCAWNDESCPFGKSRIVYHSFVGYFGAVSFDGTRQTFEEISSDSSGKATKSVLDCSTYSCANSGDCADDTGQITCACPSGFVGFDCGTYSGGISFNGYTSDFTFVPTTVPILAGDQTISIVFQKSADEIGEMVNLNIGGCDVVVKAAGGTAYKVGDTDVTVDESTITMKLDGTNVIIGGTTVMACNLDTDVLSAAATVSLGGSNPADGSEVTQQDSRYQGCISKITVNSMDIMRFNDNNVNNADTTQCVSDLAPPDPCVDSNPCLNNRECSVDKADNSPKCDCADPFIKDEQCDRKEYCVDGHVCDRDHSSCHELLTKDACEEAKVKKEGLVCEDDKRWYYYCECVEGWVGDNCADEKVDPTDETKKTTEAPPKKSDTTTIIVVVVVVAVVLGVVVTIIIVKKRRSGSGNGTTNGKAEGTYSPQAQEKDLEMSGKIEEGAEDPTNLYEDIDVIKNPNAESTAEDKEDLPPPPAPADTAITVEPSAPEPTIPPPADHPPVDEKPAAVVEPAVVVEPVGPEKPPSDQV